jgi:hypothetical protein
MAMKGWKSLLKEQWASAVTGIKAWSPSSNATWIEKSLPEKEASQMAINHVNIRGTHHYH